MMTASAKTDNHNPEAKLELRRYFLRKYHAEGPRAVLDCCQAQGRLWRELRREFVCEYWGVDIAAKKGRLKIDSVRILDQPGWTQNIVDVDTYGAPWKHWFALLRHCDHDVTVFLTVGVVNIGGISSQADSETVRALGLDVLLAKMKSRIAARGGAGGGAALKIPQSITGLARDRLGLETCIGAAHSRFQIVECIQSENPHGNANYFGVRLAFRRAEPPPDPQGGGSLPS